MKRQRNKLQIYPKKAAIKEIRQVDVIAPPTPTPSRKQPPNTFQNYTTARAPYRCRHQKQG